jgi:hypothetical protein
VTEEIRFNPKLKTSGLLDLKWDLISSPIDRL